MRWIASLVVLALVSPIASAGAISAQFNSGFGGVSWGMSMGALVGMLPGGEHHFSTAPGDRVYIVRNDDPIYGVPRENGQIQYHFGADNEVESIALSLPYERREQVMEALIGMFGAYARVHEEGTARIYTWQPDRDIVLGVRASRNPTYGILEVWIRHVGSDGSSSRSKQACR